MSCNITNISSELSTSTCKRGKHISNKERNENYMCNWTSQLYIILALSITIIALVIFTILQVRRIKLCRGQLFSNLVKVMLFI